MEKHETQHKNLSINSNIELHAWFWGQVGSKSGNFPLKNNNCCHILVPGNRHIGVLSGFTAFF
jgi:hypothetical protein